MAYLWARETKKKLKVLFQGENQVPCEVSLRKDGWMGACVAQIGIALVHGMKGCHWVSLTHGQVDRMDMMEKGPSPCKTCLK